MSEFCENPRCESFGCAKHDALAATGSGEPLCKDCGHLKRDHETATFGPKCNHLECDCKRFLSEVGQGHPCRHGFNNCPVCIYEGDRVPTPPASQPTVTLSDIDATFAQDTIMMALKWLRPYDYTSEVAKQTIARLNKLLALLRAAEQK